MRDTVEKSYLRLKCSEKCQFVQIGPSSVGGFSHAIQNVVCVRTHGKRANETNKKASVLARVSVMRARPTVTRN